MKVLYLHGWNSVVGGVNPTYLKSHGHDVHEPSLDHGDFQRALETAQRAFDQHQPDIVVESSRGRKSGIWLRAAGPDLPGVEKWGSAKITKPGTLILHARADDVVPFQDSLDLISISGLPPSALIDVGQDHRLADPETLEALLRAVERR